MPSATMNAQTGSRSGAGVLRDPAVLTRRGMLRRRYSVGAYYPTETLWPIQGVGSYYAPMATTPVAGAVEIDVCGRERKWLWGGIGVVVGVVIAKVMF